MQLDDEEEKLLRPAALPEARIALLARERAERELVSTKELLEQRTEELREQRERFEATLSSIGDAVIIFHVAVESGQCFRFMSVNPAFLSATGLREDRVIGRLVQEVIPEPSCSLAMEHYRAAIREKKTIRWEETTEYASGTKVGSVSVTPLFDNSGRCLNLVGTVHDITERNHSEETRIRLAAVVESSDDAIITKTLEGIITTWNAGAERMYGYTSEEVVGKSGTILIPPDLMDEEPAIVQRLKRGERIQHYETVRRRKDGTLLDVALTVSPIKNANGKIIGASKIARDITQRKRAERELQRAKDELEQRVLERTASLKETTEQLETFCYSIAHDLRSPLRAQQSYAEVLLEDCKDSLDEAGQEYARRIIRSAQRLDKLVNDLLAYSRLSQSDSTFEPVDLEKVIHDVQASLGHEIQEQQALISTASLLSVSAYEPTLNLVITNLVTNALKFVEPGQPPRIHLWSEARDKVVRLWVEDEGIGISPEHLDKIFGVFQRLHSRERYPGTGIGLAIVHKGIQRMGGNVGVESKPGFGSRFWIELPQAK